MRTLTAVLLVLTLSLIGLTTVIPAHCEGALAAQGPSMPPPGNPGHKEPEKGAYCDRSPHPAHECRCHAQCVEDEEGNITIVEDPKCRAWCFKKFCRCQSDCQSPSS